MTNYDPTYNVAHYNGKGRVHEFMKSQPSVVSETDMSWSVITSGPYMDMLYNVSSSQRVRRGHMHRVDPSSRVFLVR